MTARLLVGDVRAVLATLPERSVHVCVTSPPYFGLRDYGTAQWDGGDAGCDHKNGPLASSSSTLVGYTGDHVKLAIGSMPYRDICGKCGAVRVDRQIGLEGSLSEYIMTLVAVFRSVWRVLRDDGSLYLNVGDSYCGGGGYSPTAPSNEWSRAGQRGRQGALIKGQIKPNGYIKTKDLMMVPARVALALQADGWYLRSDIIWAKRAPMPESVTDRPTSAHEHVFLLTKQPRYYFDMEAVKEPADTPPHEFRGAAYIDQHGGIDNSNHKGKPWRGEFDASKRNLRNVWHLGPEPFSGARFVGDYVGPDGKAYKVSPDCPVHGHLVTTKPRALGGYGASLDSPMSRSVDTDGRPVLGRSDEPSHIASSANGGHTEGNTQPHIPQSRGGNKTPAPYVTSSENAQPCGGEIADHTRNIADQAMNQPDSSDSPSLPYVAFAIPRNSESRKTDLAPATNPPYIVSAQNLDRIDGKLVLPGFDELSVRIHENNISPADSGVHPSVETRNRTAGNSSKTKSSRCNCTIVSLDHFATFPTKLVEPCIKAGTSEKGCCPACGAPWKRVVERVVPVDAGRSPEAKRFKANGVVNHGQGERRLGAQYQSSLDASPPQTIGWNPGCICNAGPPIPCTVLDIFGGSGTTSLVADRLGRDSIYIDLSAEYAAMAKARIYGDCPMFAEVVTP